MSNFKRHNLETVPEESRKMLENVKNNYGFIPNLMGEFAEAPQALRAYVKLDEMFSETSFNPVEQEIIKLSASVANGCEYCVAVHSTVAEQKQIPQEIVNRIRDNETLSEEKYEALRRFTERIVRKRGRIAEDHLQDFLDAGFSRRQVLELLVGVSMKTLSNYTNHIAETPLDERFSAKKWERSEPAFA